MEKWDFQPTEKSFTNSVWIIFTPNGQFSSKPSLLSLILKIQHRKINIFRFYIIGFDDAKHHFSLDAFIFANLMQYDFYENPTIWRLIFVNRHSRKMRNMKNEIRHKYCLISEVCEIQKWTRFAFRPKSTDRFSIFSSITLDPANILLIPLFRTTRMFLVQKLSNIIFHKMNVVWHIGLIWSPYISKKTKGKKLERTTESMSAILLQIFPLFLPDCHAAFWIHWVVRTITLHNSKLDL